VFDQCSDYIQLHQAEYVADVSASIRFAF